MKTEDYMKDKDFVRVLNDDKQFLWKEFSGRHMPIFIKNDLCWGMNIIT